MAAERVAVLGAGNTGLSLAADLALAGCEVLLWDHPRFAEAIAPIRASKTIFLDGASRTGAARLAVVTEDPAESLSWSRVVLISVPSYAHASFLDVLSPHFRPGQVVALLPGNLGTLAFARALKGAGAAEVILAEADTAPYVCRKTASDRAVIWGAVPRFGVGVLPARRTNEAMAALRGYFPDITSYPNVLAAGLSALNPVVHPPGVLLNAGRIERSRGEFWFYEEGVTPAVVRAIEALDAERLALGQALGIALTPVAEGFQRAGFGPIGDLWATINGSQMLTALRAPGAIATRWLTEDVPYGLVTWSALAAQVDVATPVMDAVIALASAVLGVDCRAAGRALPDLGLAALDPAAMASLLDRGWHEGAPRVAPKSTPV